MSNGAIIDLFLLLLINAQEIITMENENRVKRTCQDNNDGLCIAGLITSIVSLLTCGSMWLVALGLSIGGVVRLKKKGDGVNPMGVAGIVISAISGLVSIAVVVANVIAILIYMFFIFMMLIAGIVSGNTEQGHNGSTKPVERYEAEYRTHNSRSSRDISDIDDLEDYIDKYIDDYLEDAFEDTVEDREFVFDD